MGTEPANNSLIISYLNLRKAIGVIGILLPFVLVFGKMLLETPGILNSISSYYHSRMQDVFVGSLCAIGVFLFCYRGYERKDDIAGNIAGLAAIGVALFPVGPDFGATMQQILIGKWHVFFATIFFLTLAYFALFLFRKTKPNSIPTAQKKMRNIVYTVCGSIIIVCIALIALLSFTPVAHLLQTISNPVFWLESSAIVAFGVSWFVKGEAILKDAKNN